MIDAADSWAEEHLGLLSATFDSFVASEEWPLMEELQHRFEVEGQFFDVERLGWQMPRSLGFVEQGRLVLLCRALLDIPAAESLLEDWFRVVRYSYECWLGDRKAELISHEVVDLLDGDERRTRLVSQLLLREGWMFGSGTGLPTGYWTREITAGVRVARGTGSARELLEARSTMGTSEVPPSLPVLDETGHPLLDAKSTTGSSAPGTGVEGRPGRLRRLGRLINENRILSGVAVAAILFFVNLASGGVEKLIGSIHLGSSPAIHGKVEQAAEGGARTFRVPGVMTDEGRPLKAGEKVRVACQVHVPEPASVVPEGYWYKLASSPWDGRYFAPANSFWNGDVPGELPYTHNRDKAVVVCPEGP